MSFILPTFNKNVEYFEQDPQTANFKWRFISEKDVYTPLLYPTQNIAFYDQDGIERMRYENGYRIMRKGYTWNGCSPKSWSKVLRRWIGTPDFKETILASLNHDGDYQFSNTKDFPFARCEVDMMFYKTMKALNFKLASSYYGAVKDFGKSSWQKRKNGEYSSPF
jgi:hypothetical protein